MATVPEDRAEGLGAHVTADPLRFRDRRRYVERLKEAQAVLVKYPVASQAAFAALVREGRSYAKTEEGKRYKRRLSRSPLLAKARTLFEGLARGIVTEHGGALPSTYVDGLLRALDRELEDVLADMGGVGEDP